jgi:hypothetical protein
MGLGLLLLTSVGKDNLYLSVQPEITYFKIAYKRHTNYSIEPVPQYFKSTPDFSRKCTVNISKNADLLGMIYLYVELPAIIQDNSSFLPNGIKQFAWTDKIGIALIDYIEIEIGNNIIDRHYADWINIWHELTNKKGIQSGYNKMIGSVPELTTYSNGKSNYIIYVPLTFWFCQDSGLAVPLLSLTQSDIKINVSFNNFDICYKETPNYYIQILENYSLFNYNEIITQNINGVISSGKFIYYDITTQRLYYLKINGNFIIPTIANDPTYSIVGSDTNFTININPKLPYIVRDEDYFRFNTPSLINSYLLVNYIYLDNVERYQFIKNKHEYLIPIVQTLPNYVAYSSNINYKVSLSNPNKLLVWKSILQSSIQSNDIFNYTINDDNIIINHKLIINSVERMGLGNYEHYTYLPKYQYKISSTQNGIYMYSFCLDPTNFQPSGSLNFSKVEDAYLNLTMNKNITYQNPAVITAYGLQYNLLKIEDGLGGLEFTI